jgi:hypothetical protein
MKTWYKAVCDKCGEAREIFVSNPSCTATYLSDQDEAIQTWLSKHYGHELRLICTDEQLDKLWEEGYDYAPLSCHSNYKTRLQEDADNKWLLIRKKKDV